MMPFLSAYLPKKPDQEEDIDLSKVDPYGPNPTLLPQPGPTPEPIALSESPIPNPSSIPMAPIPQESEEMKQKLFEATHTVPQREIDQMKAHIEESQKQPESSSPVEVPAPSIKSNGESPVAKLLGKTSQTPTSALLSSLTSGDAELKQAQDEANKKRLGALMLEAGDQATRGIMGAIMGRGGNIEGDKQYFKTLQEMAGQPVEDVLKRRQAKMQDIESKIKIQDFQDRTALNDPSHPISKAAREMLKQINPNLANSQDINNLSANAIFKLEPMVDAKLRSDALAQSHIQRLDEKKLKAVSDFANKAAVVIGRAGKVSNDRIQLVDAAMRLIDEYPNPNDMPTNDYNLLVAELGKIARGGAATAHEGNKISANTLRQNLAELWSKTSGQPTKAQVGDFIKNNKKYLNTLKEGAQAYIGGLIKPLYNSTKSIAGEDAMQEAVGYTPIQEYIDSYNKNNKMIDKTVTHDDAAKKWAMENIKNADPIVAEKAKKILQHLGEQ